MARQRYYDTLLAFKQYLTFLGSQGVTLPSYGTRLLWNQFMTYTAGLVPRNIAAYYPNDPGALILDSSGNVTLWSDMSGNSATNALVLNGTASNYASALDSVPTSITGDIDIQVNVALVNWASGATQTILSKYLAAGNQKSFSFSVKSTGELLWQWSADGSVLNQVQSTVTTGISAFIARFIRVTFKVNNGATGNDATFYTSTDGMTWSQLGTVVTTAGVTSIFDSSAAVQIGNYDNGAGVQPVTGRIIRAQIYATPFVIPGLIFDANFAAQSKLVTSFTESSSNAATVTVNTSGATGARICGERDLYQGTSTLRPVWTAATPSARGFATFDGTDDYLKSSAFNLNQPESVYLVGSQVTWTINDTFFDGNASLSGALVQDVSSPTITAYAGTNIGFRGDWLVGVRAIIATVFNGASSMFRVNRNGVSAGNCGAANMGGFTLGTRANLGAQAANMTASEVAIYSEAHAEAVQIRIINYFATKFGIPL